MRVQENHKARQLLLHVAWASESDPRFGMTKLNKILFYADFESFARTGKSITGEPYIKQQFGPVPIRLKKLIKDMEDSEQLCLVARSYFGSPQQRPVARIEADLSGFTAQEIALVDQVIRRLWDSTGTEVSDLSHEFVGWRAASKGEEIPYETVGLSAPPLSDEELEFANTVVRSRL
jgi:hypothetical protein